MKRKNYLVDLYANDRFIGTKLVRAENENTAKEVAWDLVEQTYYAECRTDTSRDYWEEYVEMVLENCLDSNFNETTFSKEEISEIVDMLFNSDKIWEEIDSCVYDIVSGYKELKERMLGK